MILTVSPGLLKENSSRYSMLWKLWSKDPSALVWEAIHMLSSAVSKSCPQNLLAIKKRCSKLMTISVWPSQAWQRMLECFASTWETNLLTTNSHTETTNLWTDSSSRSQKVFPLKCRISGQNSKVFQKTLWSGSSCCWNW